MKIRDVVLMGAAAGAVCLAAPAWTQGTDGVAGDRLVVPLPDVSGLSGTEAQDLTRQLAEMNVITSNCPDYDITDGEWTLLNGTTDALTRQLGLDPIAYDREYFRPAFSVLDDPEACDRLGPQSAGVIARLVGMGGDTRPVTPASDNGAEAEPAAEDSD